MGEGLSFFASGDFRGFLFSLRPEIKERGGFYVKDTETNKNFNFGSSGLFNYVY
jgi:hypothetical protein